MTYLAIRSFTVADVAAGDIRDRLEDPCALIAKCDDRWSRLVRQNPDALPEDPVLILAIDGNRVVVGLGCFAAEMQYEQKRLRTFWLAAFFRDDSYPNKAAGGMVLLDALRRCGSVAAAGSPAPRTRELYRVAGLKELPRMRRFLYFYRAAPVVQMLVRRRWLARLLAVPAEPARRVYYACRMPRWERRLVFQPVSEFSAQLDGLLERDARNRFVKSARKLNWAVRYNGSRCFEVFRDRQLAGYCLLQRYGMAEDPGRSLPAVQVGCLLDYYLSDDSRQSREDLLHWAIDQTGRWNVDVFECQCQEEALVSACVRLGLKEAGGSYVYFKPPPEVAYSPDAPWFLTHGSGDMLLLAPQSGAGSRTSAKP